MKKSTSKEARRQRAMKAHLKRQAMLEAGQEPTLSKTSGAAHRRLARERPQPQMIRIRLGGNPTTTPGRPEEKRSAPSDSNREADSNLSRSIEGRDRLPYRSNFFDHEEPSEDSGDSDFFLGDGESTCEESDDVESNGTDESIYLDVENPDDGLLDLVSEEQLLAHLEEWACNVRETRLRPRSTRGHPPGDQLAFEELRPRQHRSRAPSLSDDQPTLEEHYLPLRRTRSRSPHDSPAPVRSRSPLRRTRRRIHQFSLNDN